MRLGQNSQFVIVAPPSCGYFESHELRTRTSQALLLTYENKDVPKLLPSFPSYHDLSLFKDHVLVRKVKCIYRFIRRKEKMCEVLCASRDATPIHSINSRAPNCGGAVITGDKVQHCFNGLTLASEPEVG